MIQTCFACGQQHIGNVCPKCGYSYSIKDKCPNCTMGTCQITKRLCPYNGGTNYLQCEIILGSD